MDDPNTDSGTEEETGGRVGGSRDEDVEVLFRSDEDGLDQYECITGKAYARCVGDKVREARLRWFGHVKRRNKERISRTMLRLKPSGRRPRGRPKKI
ncbi:hypothetical protein AMECASPLE_021645 [Ameca splendens]|uniref:Uncharacterized protein n=1 Tax=Ameca splendens TaxID=208324 RepID=A0ABV0Y3P8_9TELE